MELILLVEHANDSVLLLLLYVLFAAYDPQLINEALLAVGILIALVIVNHNHFLGVIQLDRGLVTCLLLFSLLILFCFDVVF